MYDTNHFPYDLLRSVVIPYRRYRLGGLSLCVQHLRSAYFSLYSYSVGFDLYVQNYGPTHIPPTFSTVVDVSLCDILTGGGAPWVGRLPKGALLGGQIQLGPTISRH